MSGLTSSILRSTPRTTRTGKKTVPASAKSTVPGSPRKTVPGSPRKTVPVSPKKIVPVSAGKKRKDESSLIERDMGTAKSPTVQLKNTPKHLHGLDDSADLLDDIPNSPVQNNAESNIENAIEKNSQQLIWNLNSWKKTLLLLLTIAVVIQAFLWMKENPDPMQGLNLSGDADVCLRSYDELRKKLAMAFELITESGKLFKQLERQSKHQYEQMEGKHNSLSSKTIEIQKQLTILKQSQSSMKDSVDFSKFSDKEYPVDLSEMHSLIEIALERYDADKIGIPDYALESAGARIHVPYHSSTYSYGWPIVKVFGLVVWQDTRTPRELIKPETLPGNCWPLEGERGYVVIKLAARIIPSMVTMEHLHHSLARISDDTLNSTPKNFSVFSWSDQYGTDRTLLGTYIYSQHGKPRQTFPIQTVPDTPVEYVELRIGSNYGNKEYTCIYRFRMHGEPDKSDTPDSDGT